MEAHQDQTLGKLLERLEASHREELERARLQNAERFRQSELARVKAETKLEELETALGEQREESTRLLHHLTEEIAAIRQGFDSRLREAKDENAGLRQERDYQAHRADELQARCLSLQADVVRHRSASAETQRKLTAAHHSISFRLGNLLVNGLTSWRGAIALPARSCGSGDSGMPSPKSPISMLRACMPSRGERRWRP